MRPATCNGLSACILDTLAHHDSRNEDDIGNGAIGSHLAGQNRNTLNKVTPKDYCKPPHGSRTQTALRTTLGPLDPTTLGLSDPWILGGLGLLCRKGVCLQIWSSLKINKKERRAGWSAVSGHVFLQGSIQHATAWSRKGRYRTLDLTRKQKMRCQRMDASSSEPVCTSLTDLTKNKITNATLTYPRCRPT